MIDAAKLVEIQRQRAAEKREKEAVPMVPATEPRQYPLKDHAPTYPLRNK